MSTYRNKINPGVLDRIIFTENTAKTIENTIEKHLIGKDGKFYEQIAMTEISLKDEGIIQFEGVEGLGNFYYTLDKSDINVVTVALLDMDYKFVFKATVLVGYELELKSFAILKSSFKNDNKNQVDFYKRFAERVARMVFDFYRYTKVVTFLNENNRTIVKRAAITPKKKTKKELQREARQEAYRKRVSVSSEQKRYDYSEAHRGGEKRNYDRHTEKWTARGHWKTSKLGKRFWCKGSVRGDKTGKFKGKDFTV